MIIDIKEIYEQIPKDVYYGFIGGIIMSIISLLFISSLIFDLSNSFEIVEVIYNILIS